MILALHIISISPHATATTEEDDLPVQEGESSVQKGAPIGQEGAPIGQEGDSPFQDTEDSTPTADSLRLQQALPRVHSPDPRTAICHRIYLPTTIPPLQDVR